MDTTVPLVILSFPETWEHVTLHGRAVCADVSQGMGLGGECPPFSSWV